MTIKLTETSFDSDVLGTVAMRVEQHDAQRDIRQLVEQRIAQSGESPQLLLGSVMREVQVRKTDEGFQVQDIDAVLNRMRKSDDYWYLFDKPTYPGQLAPEQPSEEKPVSDEYTAARDRALREYGWEPLDGLHSENRLAQARINATAEARFKETVAGAVDKPNRLGSQGSLASTGMDNASPSELLAGARRVDAMNGVSTPDAGSAYPEGPSGSTDPITKLANARRAANPN